MPRCYLALGGNLGDVDRTFDDVLANLAATADVELIAASSRYRTRAVGADAGGDFLNAAAAIDTALSPLSLLKTCQRLETRFGKRETNSRCTS